MARLKSMPVFFWIGIPLTLLGVLAIAGGVKFGLWRSDTTGKQFADGEVIALRAHASQGRLRTPVVNYVAGGVEYDVVNGSYSDPPHYSVGENVRVVYSPDAPENGRIYSFFENWHWPIVIIVIGVIICAIGIPFVWFSCFGM